VLKPKAPDWAESRRKGDKLSRLLDFPVSPVAPADDEPPEANGKVLAHTPLPEMDGLATMCPVTATRP
jgi:hypothetical protein